MIATVAAAPPRLAVTTTDASIGPGRREGTPPGFGSFWDGQKPWGPKAPHSFRTKVGFFRVIQEDSLGRAKFQLKPGQKHGRYPTKAAMAKAVGVSTKTVTVWEAEASALGMVLKDADGMYNTLHVQAFLRRREAGPGVDGDMKPGDELKREQTLITRLRRMEMQRELVPRAEVEAFQERFAALLRDAAKRLQIRFGAEAFEILDDAIVKARKEFERVTATDR